MQTMGKASGGRHAFSGWNKGAIAATVDFSGLGCQLASASKQLLDNRRVQPKQHDPQ
jgi:hypothetical protein